MHIPITDATHSILLQLTSKQFDNLGRRQANIICTIGAAVTLRAQIAALAHAPLLRQDLSAESWLGAKMTTKG
jgi:hypothetical protein